MAQLGPNLAPTWPPKSIQNRSQDDVKMQLTEKLIFATPPMRNARFCSPKGCPKRPKMHSKTACYTSGFSTSKKHPPSFDFGPSWLPFGTPRRPQEASKASSKSLLEASQAILAASSTFWPSWGYPRAQNPIFFIKKYDF